MRRYVDRSRLEGISLTTPGLRNCTPISLDVTNSTDLDYEVSKNGLVISLIPYTYHALVIESAIRHKKHVVTTSYVSDAMKALDADAKAAGITVMNEIGLDPGIDHLYAVKTISEVHHAGGKITSFLSYCGGLPAPEDSDNPLGYKFSWSSRGVLLALRNAAKYYEDDQIVEIASEDLMSTAKPYGGVANYHCGTVCIDKTQVLHLPRLCFRGLPQPRLNAIPGTV